MATIEIIKADLTHLHYDILVNSADERLAGTAGLSLAMRRAAGPALDRECERIRQERGALKPGQIALTGSGNLHAAWVIHAVGPYWSGLILDTYHELFDCYYQSLLLADQLGARSIAFPNIATGRRGFPKSAASRIARFAVREALFAAKFVQRVCFVCHNERNFELYENGC